MNPDQDADPSFTFGIYATRCNDGRKEAIRGKRVWCNVSTGASWCVGEVEAGVKYKYTCTICHVYRSEGGGGCRPANASRSHPPTLGMSRGGSGLPVSFPVRIPQSLR